MNHIYDDGSVAFYDDHPEEDGSSLIIKDEPRGRMARQTRQAVAERRGRSAHRLQNRDVETRYRDQRELSPPSPRRLARQIRERPPLSRHSANELDELNLDENDDEQQYAARPFTRTNRTTGDDYIEPAIRHTTHCNAPDTDYMNHQSREETCPSGTNSPLFHPETAPPRHRADLLPNPAQHSNPDDTSDDEPPALPALLASRAHKLKQKLSMPPGTPGVSTRKKLPEHDPENHDIKHMRQVQHMAWSDIARALNEKRARAGRPATLTEAAVYGRFVRNGKRIAEATGEAFNPSDYMHLKHPRPAGKNVRSAEPTPKFSEEMDELLVRAVDTTTKRFWKHVADELQVTGGMYFSEAVLQKRFNTI